MNTEFGIDYTTQYFFRGIHQEGEGLIIQPYLEVSGNFVKDIDFKAGIWNSLHDGSTGTNGGQKPWYEADVYCGLDYSLGNLGINVTYMVVDSPNSVFGTTEEIQLNLSYDDSGMHKDGKFGGLNPHVTLLRELQGGSDAGVDRGTYLEIGIEPSYQATKDVNITVPVTVGLSLDDYYENIAGNDQTLGFWSVGVVATVPVSHWDLSVGLQHLELDNFTQAINGGSGDETILTVGMSVSW